MAKNDGAGRIADSLRIYFAPETANSINQEGVRYRQLRIAGRIASSVSRPNPSCRWPQDSSMPPYPPCARNARLFRTRTSRWCWPAHTEAGPSCMFRWPCEDYLVPAAVRLVETFWRRWIWTSSREVTGPKKRVQRTRTRKNRGRGEEKGIGMPKTTRGGGKGRMPDVRRVKLSHWNQESAL